MAAEFSAWLAPLAMPSSSERTSYSMSILCSYGSASFEILPCSSSSTASSEWTWKLCFLELHCLHSLLLLVQIWGLGCALGG